MEERKRSSDGRCCVCVGVSMCVCVCMWLLYVSGCVSYLRRGSADQREARQVDHAVHDHLEEWESEG